MIGLTMRMEKAIYPSGNVEFRDCLGQNWWPYLSMALPNEAIMPIPNLGTGVTSILHAWPFTGFIFSGGDDWGIFPQRDVTETLIHEFAKTAGLPVVGVCRGAQVLNLLEGGKLSPGFEAGHVCKRHKMQISADMRSRFGLPPCPEVNSYHAMGIAENDLAAPFVPWAQTHDGSVEGFADSAGRVCGVLWHPEREEPFASHDFSIFKYYLGKRRNG